VGNDTLVRQPLLVDNTTDGNHGQSAVLDFAGLESGIVCLSNAQRVKVELSWLTVSASVHLDACWYPRDDFPEAHEQEDLLEGTLLNKEGVCRVGEGWGTCVEREGEEFGDDESERGQHADASVLDLGLLHPLDVEPVGESKRIKVGTSRNVRREVCWLLHEWHGSGLGHHGDGRLAGNCLGADCGGSLGGERNSGSGDKCGIHFDMFILARSFLNTDGLSYLYL